MAPLVAGSVHPVNGAVVMLIVAGVAFVIHHLITGGDW